MKIAIPTADGILCAHFGHCREFAIVHIDTEKKEIISTEMQTPPPHEPGVLPQWLNQLGCDVIIAGGMGQRAISMFNQFGIQVVIGAPSQNPEAVVAAFLNDSLTVSENPCDSQGHHSHHGHGGGCGSHG
jgi:predicted Fe-Mo cluster-binding NifX family protein